MSTANTRARYLFAKPLAPGNQRAEWLVFLSLTTQGASRKPTNMFEGRPGMQRLCRTYRDSRHSHGSSSFKVDSCAEALLVSQEILAPSA